MQTMQAPETTKVIYGVNELDLDLAGKTVRGIWKALEQGLQHPPRCGRDGQRHPGRRRLRRSSGRRDRVPKGSRREGSVDLTRWPRPSPEGSLGPAMPSGVPGPVPSGAREPEKELHMHSRKYLRIEGDLVSLVSEIVDREVALPDLLAGAHHHSGSTQPKAADRLPLLGPLGDDRPSGLRRRAGPVAADDRVPRQPTLRLRAGHLPARRAVRRLRRLDDRRTDRGPGDLLPNRVLALTRRSTLALVPAEYDRRRSGLSRIGPGERGERRRTGRRAHRRVLGEPLQPGPPAPSAAVQRWLPVLGVPLAAGSARRPVPAVRPLLADPPPGRLVDGRASHNGSAAVTPIPDEITEIDVRTPEPPTTDGDDADALAS